MADDPPKLRSDGEVDGRGHGEGSKAWRFQAGDNRPRRGRPKGSRDKRTIVHKIRDMTVQGTESNGKRFKVDTFGGILLKMRQKALAGDLRAAEFLLKWFEKFEPPVTDAVGTSDLLAVDAMILASTRRRGLLPGDEGDDGEGGEA